jgi:hypothetical protein
MARPPLPIGSWGEISTWIVQTDDEGNPTKYKSQARYRDHDGQVRPVSPAGVQPARVGAEVPADLVGAGRGGRVRDGGVAPPPGRLAADTGLAPTRRGRQHQQHRPMLWRCPSACREADGRLGQHSGPRSDAAGRSTPSSICSSATTWPSAHPTTWPPRSPAASPNALRAAEDQPETAMSSRRNVVGVPSSSVLAQARVTVRPRYGVRSTD